MSEQQPPQDPQQLYGQQPNAQQPNAQQPNAQQPYGQQPIPPAVPSPYGQSVPPPPVYGPPGSAHGYPPNSDERTWAMLAHGTFFVLGLIGPLVIMLTKGKDSPYVRRAAVEALNFHISLFLYSLVSAVLVIVLIGIFTLLATFVFGLVVAIMAIVAANRGEDYRYPFTIRMVS